MAGLGGFGGAAALRGACSPTELTESLIADKTKFPKTPNSQTSRDLHNHPPTVTPSNPRTPTNPPDSKFSGAKMRGKRSKQYRKLMEQ